MIKIILQQLLQLLFPVTCSGCGKDLPADDYFRLCPSCEKEVKYIEGLYCLKCGLPLPDGGAHCFNCRGKTNYHFEFIRSACVFEGVVRDLIHKFKYYGRDYLDRVLGRFLFEAIGKEPLLKNVDLIIPVPIHGVRRFFRGYNQAELLAKSVADYLKKPLLTKLLYRKRMTKAQFSLSRNDRINNLKDCFALRGGEKIKGKTVLLIDDVCTTGTTIEECSKVLKKARAGNIYGLTVARD